MVNEDHEVASLAARQLLRSAPFGSLATVMRESGGCPYASMAATATDHDGAPILLLSDLADHTKNLKLDDRVSLLLIGGDRLEDPMAGERLTLQGRLARSTEPIHRQRYLARHPSASLYADFADFAFYRMTIEKAHLVAGFGKIHWLPGGNLTILPPPALAEAESEIVAHMNDDHADAIELYATKLLRRSKGDWSMTGVDAEGADLRHRDQVARLPFDARVEDSTAVRSELVRLVNKAREA
jgi:putative heme iron utilization protein